MSAILGTLLNPLPGGGPTDVASPPSAQDAGQAAGVAALDWSAIADALDARGFATTGPLLTAAQCAAVAATYDDEAAFRSRVVMARHGFGRGEYKYFAYPLPPLVQLLRTAFYAHLAPIANEWQRRLGSTARFPASLEAMLARCHRAGQRRPTALLLKYGAGDYNCLHQDLYGDLLFPLQVAFLLSEPAREFEGGEFVLVEQRPRMQSRASVVPLTRGEGVIFAVNRRPVQGVRGNYAVKMRHGVSEVRAGWRMTLGIIFHDAQ